MKKRALAIVCGGNQLLFAAQVKHTIYKHISMDMAYLDIDISEEAARQLFDGVYKIKSNVAPPKSRAFRCFVFPVYAIKAYYADIDPKGYTDVFFWGPTWLYYFLYKYSVYSRHKYSWHLLPEGAGAYMLSVPVCPPKKFGIKPLELLIRLLDRICFGYSKKNIDIIEDIYLIHPEYSITEYPVTCISVLPFDSCEREYINTLNSMLKYEHLFIKNKVIIIDGALDRSRRSFYDDSMMDELIYEVGRTFGKENVLLKRKHGVKIDQYDKDVINNVTLFEKEDMPWELVCLNGDIQDCIIVSVPTSAIVLPFVFGGFGLSTFIIGDGCVSYRIPAASQERFRKYCKRIIDESNNYREIDSLKEIIRQLYDAINQNKIIVREGI